MANISTINLPVVDYDTVEDILVNGNGTTGRINKTSLLKKIGDWSSVTNKPFDALDYMYFRVEEDDDGIKTLTYTDDFIAALDTVDTLSTDIKNINSDIENIKKKSHSHDNINVINKFSVDSENKLIWNDIAVGSDYELPIASSDVLGGVKIDGSSITIDEGGTIHGATTYELPVATDEVLGGVKVDNTSITIDENGVISCTDTGNATISQWSSDNNYTTDNLVVYDNSLYICIENHISTEEFDTDKWQVLTGERGEKGYSPTVQIKQTDDGATVSVTDANGTTTATIQNGSDGRDGVTPHIDEDSKHWFVGDTDTGITAEGISKIVTSAVVYSGTLSVDSWIGDTAPYIQTIPFADITEQSRPYINLKISDDVATGIEEMNQWNCITKAKTTDGEIAFYCFQSKPTIDMNFEAEVR